MIGLILTLLACHPDDRPAPVDCAAVDTTRLPEAPELQRWLDARVERGEEFRERPRARARKFDRRLAALESAPGTIAPLHFEQGIFGASHA